MGNISAESFRLYCDRIDDAVNSCKTDYQRRRVANLAKIMLSGESIAVRREAREMLIQIASGLYSRSAEIQIDAVDSFCDVEFDIGSSGTLDDLQYEQIKEQIGYLAKDLAKTSDSEKFATRFTDWVAKKSEDVANDRMEKNVKAFDKREGRKTKFAYIPAGSLICGFCCMMASRKYDFSANAKKKLHDHCNCKLVPDIDGKRIEGWDPESYENGYEALYKGKDENGKPIFDDKYVYDLETNSAVQKDSEKWDLSIQFSVRFESLLNEAMECEPVRQARLNNIEKNRKNWEAQSLDETVNALMKNPRKLKASKTGQIRIVDADTSLQIRIDPRSGYFRIEDVSKNGYNGTYVDGSMPDDSLSVKQKDRLTHYRIGELEDGS